MVFPRAAVEAILSSPRVAAKSFDAKPIADFRKFRYKDHTPPVGLLNGMVDLDGMLWEAFQPTPFREVCHRPSLVEHTGGADSMMGHDKSPPASDFPGEEALASNLLLPVK